MTRFAICSTLFTLSDYRLRIGDVPGGMSVAGCFRSVIKSGQIYARLDRTSACLFGTSLLRQRWPRHRLHVILDNFSPAPARRRHQLVRRTRRGTGVSAGELIVVRMLRSSSAAKSSQFAADIPAMPSTCLSPNPAERSDSRTASCEIVSARTRRPVSGQSRPGTAAGRQRSRRYRSGPPTAARSPAASALEAPRRVSNQAPRADW